MQKAAPKSFYFLITRLLLYKIKDIFLSIALFVILYYFEGDEKIVVQVL
jgi:hypothetical protein